MAARRLGAALGAVGGPVAGYGAAWSGVGPGGWAVPALALLLGALLGALSWPIFHDAGRDPLRPGPGFAALFGGTVGMMAGALAGFPVGGVLGALGGAPGGAVAALAWRTTGRLGPIARPAAAGGAGMAVALAVGYGMVA